MGNVMVGDSSYAALLTNRIINNFEDGTFVSQVFQSLSSNVVQLDPFDQQEVIQMGYSTQNGTGRIEAPDSTVIKNISSFVKDIKTVSSHVIQVSTQENRIEFEKNPTLVQMRIGEAVRLLDAQAAQIQMSKLSSALVQGTTLTYSTAFNLFSRINDIILTIIDLNAEENRVGDWRLILPYKLVRKMSGLPATKESFMSQKQEFEFLLNSADISYDTSLQTDNVLVYDANKITHYKGQPVSFEALEPTSSGKTSQDRFVIEVCTDDIFAGGDATSIGESFLVSI